MKTVAILLLLSVLIVPLVSAQTNPLPGDYNFDGFVDIRDYGVWRVNFGRTGPADCSLLADGNCDGIVDIRDYGIWRENFGRSGPTQTPAVIVVSATPDPRFTSTRTPTIGPFSVPTSTSTPTRPPTSTPSTTPTQNGHPHTHTPCPAPNPHC